MNHHPPRRKERSLDGWMNGWMDDKWSRNSYYCSILVALAQLIFIFSEMLKKYLNFFLKIKNNFFVKENWKIFWGKYSTIKKREYSELIN
jgi:hypothetical protein